MTAKQFVKMVAKMKTEDEYPDFKAPPSEDWISGMNELIETARKIAKKNAPDNRKAVAACRSLLEAYELGELRGGSMDWADVDSAHGLAIEALGKEKK